MIYSPEHQLSDHKTFYIRMTGTTAIFTRYHYQSFVILRIMCVWDINLAFPTLHGISLLVRLYVLLKCLSDQRTRRWKPRFSKLVINMFEIAVQKTFPGCNIQSWQTLPSLEVILSTAILGHKAYPNCCCTTEAPVSEFVTNKGQTKWLIGHLAHTEAKNYIHNWIMLKTCMNILVMACGLM